MAVWEPVRGGGGGEVWLVRHCLAKETAADNDSNPNHKKAAYQV
jgi:hypothetical protein